MMKDLKYEKKRLDFLEGMRKLKESPVKAEDYTSPLSNDMNIIKGSTVKEPTKVIKGVTEVIGDSTPMNTISGSDFTKKLDMLKALRKTKIPVVGGIAALASGLMSDDVSAAEGIVDAVTPSLLETDRLGPQKGSLAYRLENGERLTEEELEQLK